MHKQKRLSASSRTRTIALPTMDNDGQTPDGCGVLFSVLGHLLVEYALEHDWADDDGDEQSPQCDNVALHKYV